MRCVNAGCDQTPQLTWCSLLVGDRAVPPFDVLADKWREPNAASGRLSCKCISSKLGYTVGRITTERELPKIAITYAPLAIYASPFLMYHIRVHVSSSDSIRTANRMEYLDKKPEVRHRTILAYGVFARCLSVHHLESCVCFYHHTRSAQ